MLVIFSLIIELVIGSLILDKSTVYEEFSIACIVLNSIMILILLHQNYSRYITPLLIAYFIRVFLLFADYYKLFPIIHSGMDSEAFHYIAMQNAKVGMLRYQLTNYSTIISIFYFIIGTQRLFVQYINVLCGMGTIFFIIKSLDLLKLEKSTKTVFVSFACFLPHFIIFSGIFLRESLIIFAVSISVYFFVKWYLRDEIYNFVFSCLFVLFAAWLHSGMIGCLAGYLIGYSLYDKKSKELKFKFNSIGTISVCCMLFIYLISTGYFTGYFDKLLDSEDEFSTLVEQVNFQSEGGSAYLTWINANNPIQAILFSSLKMLYFLFSPLPWDWRGISDIIAFCFSSLIVFYLIWITFKHLKYIKKKSGKTLVKILLIASLITTFIYSLGVAASGPAMRHRTKIVPILIVTAALAYDAKLKNNKKILYNGKDIINIQVS